MSFFIHPGQIPSDALQGDYDRTLVALSYAVAAASAYLALSILIRMLPGNGQSRMRGCFLGAVVMGNGIWSMHFIGMLAYKMPMVHTYDMGLTALSMAVAVVFSWAVFYNITRHELTLKTILLSAPLMGGGIAAMHYTGMAAMQLHEHGELRYLPLPFALSIAMAVAASAAAMMVMRQVPVFQRRRQAAQVSAALILGLAVCGMHYTGMMAAVFIPGAEHAMDAPQHHPILAAFVTGATALILLGGALALMMGFIGKKRMPIRIKLLLPLAIGSLIALSCLWLYMRQNAWDAAVEQAGLRAEALASGAAKLARIDGYCPAFASWISARATEPNIEALAVSATGAKKLIANAGERRIAKPSLEEEMAFRFHDASLTEAARLGAARRGLFREYAENDLDYVYLMPITIGGSVKGAPDMSAVIYIQIEFSSYVDALNAEMRKIGIIMAAGSLLFIGFMYFLLQHSILKPIFSIRRAISQRAGGQTAAYAQVSSADEIGDLALAFNDMVDALSAVEKDRLEREKAEAANKAKSEFLANMSHELRTPMHAILSYAQIALKTLEADADENLKKFLGNIRISGQRLLSLLNNLLDLSKMEAGKMELKLQPGGLHQAMDHALTELHPLLSDKKIAVKISCAEMASTAATLHDRGLMIQVFVNLLSNAIKFSPPGGAIGVAYARAGNTLACSVTNSGPPIPPDELEIVFNPFTQSSATRTKAGGTGLGLSICRQIIHAHHGRIWAENIPGGVTFHVQLPLEQPT